MTRQTVSTRLVKPNLHPNTKIAILADILRPTYRLSTARELVCHPSSALTEETSPHTFSIIRTNFSAWRRVNPPPRDYRPQRCYRYRTLPHYYRIPPHCIRESCRMRLSALRRIFPQIPLCCCCAWKSSRLRLNFELLCNWMETSHVLCLLDYDWI